MPIINECLNAESITLLGQEWHMNGMSLSVLPDMSRLNKCITINFGVEKNRGIGAVANLRCLPGVRYDFHKDVEADNA